MDTNENFENVPFDQWTSCEMYGCDFVEDVDDPTLRYCRDCGAWYHVECD